MCCNDVHNTRYINSQFSKHDYQGADDDELYKEFKPIFSELISPQNTGVSEEAKATVCIFRSHLDNQDC